MLMKQLQVFPSSSQAKQYRVFAGAELGKNTLRLRFKIESDLPGAVENIILPAAKSERKNDLWKETCFECFIASEHAESYFEFNGTADGCWNVYSFKKYREGMSETKLSKTPFQKSFLRGESGIESVWELSITEMGKVKNVGLSLVLKTHQDVGYWALTHDGAKPDFHLRSSFIYPVTVEGVA